MGGYVQWLQDKIRRETKNEKVAEVEQGLRKKFHRVIFSRFAKAIKTYDLIQPNDRIAVCISGGKDSMLMAKLFQELQRHGKFPFELVFLVMDTFTIRQRNWAATRSPWDTTSMMSSRPSS